VVGQPGEEPFDVRQLVGVVDRAEQRVLVVGQADGDAGPGVLRQRRDEVVVDPRTGDDSRGRGAVLSGVEVAGGGDGLDGGLQIRVVEDDDRRLATELEVDPLEITGGALGHLHAGPNRAGDRDHCRRLVLDDGTSGVAVAGHHVERPGRKELGGDLRKQQGGLGRGVARLEDDGVSGGQRWSDLPDGHHHRVVPGRDLPDHADRLATDPRRVALHVLTGRAALQDPGGTGEEPDLVNHRWQLFAGRERVRLAGVLRFQVHELISAGLDGISKLQQRPLPLAGRRVTPHLEGRGSRRIGTVHLSGRGQRRPGNHLRGHRADDVRAGVAIWLDVVAVDEVA